MPKSTRRRLSSWTVLVSTVGLAVAFVSSCSDGATGTTGLPTTLEAGTAAVTTTGTPTTTSGPVRSGTPVVVDTDLARDSVMAILYLLGRPDLDVRAITVSGTGEVHCEPGVRIAAGLVELARASEIPVACGPEQPLQGVNAFPSEWRAAADDAWGLHLPQGGQPSALPAPELLVSVISSAVEPVVVFTDGPLTNLAAAIRLDPGIVGSIGMVFTMGGAVDVAGNTDQNPMAEYNIWVDPVAAAEVLASGLPLTLVPLDATNQVPLHLFHLRALQEHQATPGAQAAVTMLSADTELMRGGGGYFWDQLTAALLVDESLAGFETMRLGVVTDGGPESVGAINRASDGSEVRVAVTVDAERFEREFLSALAGEDVGPITVTADITADFDGENWTLVCPRTLASGEYTLVFTNWSTVDAVLAFGQLTGDATEADVLAWTSLDQPPPFSPDGFYAAPGGRAIAVIDLSQSGTHYIEGMDFGRHLVSNLGRIEVTD